MSEEKMDTGLTPMPLESETRPSVDGSKRPRAAANHEVETYTGRYVDVSDPHPDTIAIEDIAHGLAHTCRFGGQCFRFYSVAEHAVYVADKIAEAGGDPMLVMAGLHHDDAEAYLGDIPRPMKRLLGEAYAEMTADMDFAIYRALAWPKDPMATLLWHTADFKHELVKAADEWALASEARMLLPSRGDGWQLAELKWSVAHGMNMFGLPPSIAEKQWLDAHEKYARRVSEWNPSSSGPLASTKPPGVSPLNPSPSAVSGQEGGEDR